MIKNATTYQQRHPLVRKINRISENYFKITPMTVNCVKGTNVLVWLFARQKWRLYHACIKLNFSSMDTSKCIRIRNIRLVSNQSFRNVYNSNISELLFPLYVFINKHICFNSFNIPF